MYAVISLYARSLSYILVICASNHSDCFIIVVIYPFIYINTSIYIYIFVYLVAEMRDHCCNGDDG